MRVMFFVVVLSLGLLVMPAVPALEEVAPVEDAAAEPCVWGWDDDCIIPAYPCFNPDRIGCE